MLMGRHVLLLSFLLRVAVAHARTTSIRDRIRVRVVRQRLQQQLDQCKTHAIPFTVESYSYVVPGMDSLGISDQIVSIRDQTQVIMESENFFSLLVEDIATTASDPAAALIEATRSNNSLKEQVASILSSIVADPEADDVADQLEILASTCREETEQVLGIVGGAQARMLEDILSRVLDAVIAVADALGPAIFLLLFFPAVLWFNLGMLIYGALKLIGFPLTLIGFPIGGDEPGPFMSLLLFIFFFPLAVCFMIIIDNPDDGSSRETMNLMASVAECELKSWFSVVLQLLSDGLSFVLELEQ